MRGPRALKRRLAYAELWLAGADSRLVSPEDRELAIRLFITGCEEMYDYPVDIPNKFAAYEKLSGFFSLTHDPVSAYAAAVIARDYLEQTSEPTSWRQDMRAVIERRIQRLAPLLPRPE